MKNIIQLSLIIFISYFFFSCSDNKNEPSNVPIVGYWAVTHMKTIETKDSKQTINEEDVEPHGEYSYFGEVNYRSQVIIFDNELATVRCYMLPNSPEQKDYNMDTIEGQFQYEIDREYWYNSMGTDTDMYGFPIGKYDIKDNSLFIGTSYLGKLNFISDNQFTLQYKKTFNSEINSRTHIYTFSRIYSLSL